MEKKENRRAVRFRQVEASRAIRAVEAAGLQVGSVECCPDGKIIVHTKNPQEATPQENEWDEAIAKKKPIPVR
jgi:hypothetical protein